MEAQAYAWMADLEQENWWYKARREILSSVLGSLKLSRKAEILEVGCGTGGNLSMLRQYGDVYATEEEAFARGAAESRHVAQQVSDNDIECAVPYAGKEFDLVAMYDVLEHLENEISSLKNIHKALRKNGILMITVPAYMFLWSKHDEMVHHKRRYTREDLVRLVASQGYQVERSSYFNTWLFPPIALVRLIRRMCKSDVHHQEDKLANPADWINRILYRVFASEKYLLKLSNLPFGVSILLVARKA